MHESDGSCMRFSGGSTLEDRWCLVRLTGALGLTGLAGATGAVRGASPALGLAEVDMLKRGGSTARGLTGVGVLVLRKRGDRAGSAALGLAGVVAAGSLKGAGMGSSPARHTQHIKATQGTQKMQHFDRRDCAKLHLSPCRSM